MKTVFSPLHAGHSGQMELVAGAIVPGFEKPSRAEIIRARVESEKLGPILPPDEHDLAAAKRVHAADFIDFLPTVWPMWKAAGRSGSAMPFTWPTRGLRGDVRPQAHRRAARLLFLRRRRDLRRRHLGCDQIVLRRGADRRRRWSRIGERGRLRALPAARPSRRRRLHGRLLLHQQRRRRRAMVPRPGRGEGRHPRRRLSPRQRHAGDLLRARRTCWSSICMATR